MLRRVLRSTVAWPLVDRRGLYALTVGAYWMGRKCWIDQATDMAQGRLGTKWNPFSLAGRSHPSHRPKGNGGKTGPNHRCSDWAYTQEEGQLDSRLPSSRMQASSLDFH